MAVCQHCESTLTGPYCSCCGTLALAATRIGGERKSAGGARPGRAQPDSLPPPAPAAALPQRRSGGGYALALLGCGLFVAGLIAGSLLGTSPGVRAPEAAAASDRPVGNEVTASDLSGLPPVAAAGRLVEQALGLMEKGEQPAAAASFRQAVAQYEAALRQDPEDLYARSYLGLTYYYLGDNTQAVASERAALDKDPNYLWAIFNLAWIQAASGQAAEAVSLYQRYLSAVPSEKENRLKYAEHVELIDRQIAAAREALLKLQGGSQP